MARVGEHEPVVRRCVFGVVVVEGVDMLCTAHMGTTSLSR